MGRQRWEPGLSARTPQARTAVEYAERMHAGQRRGDGTRFMVHPLEVGGLLEALGAPDHVVAAGVLHDVIEKTDATADEVRERFGPAITDLVLAVTDDDRIADYEQRKAALRRQVAGSGEEALSLFAADKLSKLRELSREASQPGRVRRPTRARRLRHYQRSLAMLEERLPGSPLVRQLRNELDALLRHRSVLARIRT